jgi:predicted membrane-bound spermidine synthase
LKPFRLLDCVVSRDNRELTLYQRGDAFYIQIDGYDLMSSRAHGSEDQLARLALAALRSADGGSAGAGAGRWPRVLVGGLGMGFTLRATLDALAARRPARSEAEVVVAEVFPAVIEWNRGPLAHLAGRPLADPRVRIVVGDVAERLAEVSEEARPYDVVLLDVDNGPEAITLEANDRLYTPKGLARAYGALVPGGVLAVWSANDDPRFADRLRRAGFRVETHRVSERSGGKGGRHVIFVGTRDRSTASGTPGR